MRLVSYVSLDRNFTEIVQVNKCRFWHDLSIACLVLLNKSKHLERYYCDPDNYILCQVGRVLPQTRIILLSDNWLRVLFIFSNCVEQSQQIPGFHYSDKGERLIKSVETGKHNGSSAVAVFLLIVYCIRPAFNIGSHYCPRFFSTARFAPISVPI